MANTLLTLEAIARQAYANLYENAVMARLVHRDYAADFDGKVGDTITVRRPATFEANVFDRSNGIDIQNATETGIPVVLDTLLDVSFAVTAEDMALSVPDFNAQLLQPATQAIAQGIDRTVLSLLADVTASTPLRGVNAARTLIDAGRILNEANVPASDRHAVWTPAAAAAVLEDPVAHEADKRGDTDGLREASIGRMFSFDNWMTQNLDSDSVAFHSTAFALVTRTLELPGGASNAAVFGADGFGIRVVQDYDITRKQDVVSLDVLIGVKTLDASRAVIVTNDES
jgi:hypothetical protein